MKWRSAVELGTSNTFAGVSQMSIDSNGNGFVFWAQSDGTYNSIYASRYSTGTWGSALELDNTSLNADYYPANMDVNGNIFVPFRQDDGTGTNIYMRRYSSSSDTWSSALALAPYVSNSSLPRVYSLDTNGNALFVYPQTVGSYIHTYARSYNAGTATWSAPMKLDTAAYNSAPQLTTPDANGNAFVVFTQTDVSGHPSLYVRRYTASTDSWSPAAELDTTTNNASTPIALTDANGNAFVAWIQSDGSYNSAYLRRYVAGTGTWSAASEIDTTTFNAVSPTSLTLDNDGNVWILWTQLDGTGANSIYARRYNAATDTLNAAVEVDTSSYHAIGGRLQKDSSGNLFVSWTQSNGTYNSAFVRRYYASTSTWGPAIELDTTTYNASSSRFLLDVSTGNGFAVYIQSDGTYNSVYVRRYNASTDTWGIPMELDTSAYNAIPAGTSIDAAGNAIFTWTQSDGTYMSYYARRYESSSNTWSPAVELDTSTYDANTALLVSNSANGKAITAWGQSDGTHISVYARAFE
ncbi:MAG: hypothetical protein QM808_06800 [Steroidobacteraceae bacterium]